MLGAKGLVPVLVRVAYAVGEFFLVDYFIGWLWTMQGFAWMLAFGAVLWFVLCQAWGVTLGVLTERVDGAATQARSPRGRSRWRARATTQSS